MKRVLVFGTFDILHPGHLYFFKQSKKYGNFLIVSLAREKYIRKIKGRKAFHTETARKKLLEALKIIDKVVLGSKGDYIGHILSQNPEVIALGYDQKAFTEGLEKKLAKRGWKGKIVKISAYQPSIYKSSKFLR